MQIHYCHQLAHQRLIASVLQCVALQSVDYLIPILHSQTARQHLIQTQTPKTKMETNSLKQQYTHYNTLQMDIRHDFLLLQYYTLDNISSDMLYVTS